MPSRQNGIAMIEVMISIVVIAFGFTALLKLQMVTLNNATSSYQYYLASALANDMGERIRSNRGNIVSYNNINTKTFLKNCNGQACTTTENDIFEWKAAINEGTQTLNGGEGSINIGGGLASISLSWLEKQNYADAERVNYTLEVPIE